MGGHILGRTGNSIRWILQMSSYKGYKYLLVYVDTFPGWIKAFPCETEKATEVTKSLLREITPRTGFPRSTQSDIGPSFIVQITEQIALDLKINYLHSAWHPQCSRKVEKANHTLKRHLAQSKHCHSRKLGYSFSSRTSQNENCPRATNRGKPL